MTDTTAQTLEDLSDDIAELVYLAGSGNHKLAMYSKAQGKTDEDTERLSARYNALREELETALADYGAWNKTDIPTLLALKKRVHLALRALHLLGAAAMSSAEWQSPSFLHSQASQAGKYTGDVTGNVNDYQRDHHYDARAYEQAFRSEYITAMRTPGVSMTSSGMAAMTTVIVGLHNEGKLGGNVIVGKSSYFEYKEVLAEFCGDRLHEVDEMNISAVIDEVIRLKPSAIFIDSLCNVEAIAVPNLPKLIPAIAHAVTTQTTLVVDNTGLGPTCQVLAMLPRGTDLGLVVVESLQKYHQFGFDGVTGGIIWRDAATRLNIFRHRMHLGTNIADTSALALPSPNNEMLATRMNRLGRNATLLATALNTHYTAKPHMLFSHVVYPGLPSHPAYTWTKDAPFNGSFFTLAFRKFTRFPLLAQAWMRLVIHEAKAANVDINAGSSFGFNTTRIYLTARHATHSTVPFIRISAGTETQQEVETLAAVLIRATDRLTL